MGLRGVYYEVIYGGVFFGLVGTLLNIHLGTDNLCLDWFLVALPWCLLVTAYSFGEDSQRK